MIRRPFGVALLSVALATIATGSARADVSQIGVPTFELRILGADMKFNKPGTEEDQRYYFNRAHCICGLAKAGAETQFDEFITIPSTPAPGTKFDSAGEIWSGPSCDSTINTPTTTQCEKFSTGISHWYSDLYARGDNYLLDLVTLMAPRPTTATGDRTCTPTDGGTGTVWIFADPSGSGQKEKVTSTSINFDTKPPDLPTAITAVGGESAIDIKFTPPTSTSDLYVYQALCTDTAGAAIKAAANIKPLYRTALDLCNIASPDDTPITYQTAAGTSASAPTGPAADNLATLGEAYLCGGGQSTDNHVRIDGLENGKPYHVLLLAIDKWGNAQGVEIVDEVTPIASTDFWEDAHDQGSQVESGFCLISSTYGDGGPITQLMRAFRDDDLGGSGLGRAFTRFYYAHVAWLGAYASASWPVRVLFAIVLFPLIAIALAWHALGLPALLLLGAAAWWLRRRRGRRAQLRTALAALAVLAIATRGGAAHAQPDAYWNDDDSIQAEDTGVVRGDWIVGVRIGRYVPGIDKQLQSQTNNADAKPYRQMFGGYALVPFLDIDRVIWRGFGELTVGGSIGFLNRSASSFTSTSMASDGYYRARSDGDNNAFRMIPMAALVGYRFTYLDDTWGIPIVPYARGGLAYYAWWLKGPDGKLAFTGDGNCHPSAAECATKQSAIGGSMGLQASVGLAIRAERIDPDAASSMQQGGIAHAGFYAEWQGGWVDSFGNSHRLSLGDSTFFAGVNFEF